MLYECDRCGERFDLSADIPDSKFWAIMDLHGEKFGKNDIHNRRGFVFKPIKEAA